MKTASVIGLLIIAILLLAGCRKNQTPDSKEFEAKIKQALPIGTSKEKVDAYLSKQNIEHSYHTKENRIYALMRNLAPESTSVSKSLSIIFYFSENGGLTNVQSKIEYTGP